MPYDPDRHGPHRVVGPGFHEKVYALVEKIPRGKVTTYGDIGAALGLRAAARQVGFALAALNDRSREIPWYRVVNRKGEVSARGEDQKCSEQEKRLRAEGLRFDDRGRIRDFELHRFRFSEPEEHEVTSLLEDLE